MDLRQLIHPIHHRRSELGLVKISGKEGLVKMSGKEGLVKMSGKERSETMKEQGQIKGGAGPEKQEARIAGDRRKGRNKRKWWAKN